MDANDVRELLRAACEKAGGQAAWAVRAKVSAAYVSDILQGRRDPGKKVTDALGIKRIVEYRKVGK